MIAQHPSNLEESPDHWKIQWLGTGMMLRVLKIAQQSNSCPGGLDSTYFGVLSRQKFY